MELNSKFYLIDFFASEYKWSFDEIVKFVFETPNDIVMTLYKTALKRQKETIQLKTKLMAYAVGAGFSGKIEILDEVFGIKKKAEVSEAEYLNGVRILWAKMGRDPKKLEEMIKSGEMIKF